MTRIAAAIAMAVCISRTAQPQEPEGLLDRFLERMHAELARLPDYACAQTIERFSRPAAERAWEKVDSLRFEVALVGNRELYARPGAPRFEDRPLAEMVGRGTISTGQHGLTAKHVFAMSREHLTYRGQGEQDGRRAYEYSYDVPPERSSYRLRSGAAESTVGFQGAFWIDAATLDLIRLEAQAYDMPERLGLAEANTALTYSRVTIDDANILLPVSASFSMAAVDGVESLNRIRLSGCRHYRAESAIRFPEEPPSADRTERSAGRLQPQASAFAIPKGVLLDLALEESLDPPTAKIGDPVRARVAQPVKDGERTLVPQGAVVRGNVVRLEKQAAPLQLCEIGLEPHTLEMADQSLKVNITMEDAGPAAGLVRQARRLDPKFTRRRTGKMDILVREVQRGQGILHWDARHCPIPRGLRMKWRAEGEAQP